MEGYSGAQQVTRDRMTAPTTPARLPEALRGEQYAFVTLPVAEVQAGGGVTEDNVGVGKMINVKSDFDPGRGCFGDVPRVDGARFRSRRQHAKAVGARRGPRRVLPRRALGRQPARRGGGV